MKNDLHDFYAKIEIERHLLQRMEECMGTLIQLGTGTDGRLIVQVPLEDSLTVLKLFDEAVSFEAKHPAWAMRRYRDVIAIEPNNVDAHLNLGNLLYAKRNLKEALAEYLIATEIAPKWATAHYGLGVVFHDLKMLKNAVCAYKIAIGIDPSHAYAHYNLALAYDKMKGCRREALKHWRIYAALDSHGSEHDRAIKRIRKILKKDKLKVVFRSLKRRSKI